MTFKEQLDKARKFDVEQSAVDAVTEWDIFLNYFTNESVKLSISEVYRMAYSRGDQRGQVKDQRLFELMRDVCVLADEDPVLTPRAVVALDALKDYVADKNNG